MQVAAQQQQYEQAASIHQDLRAVTWLCNRAEDVATARQRFTFIYRVPDASSRSNGSIWYLIRRGVIEGAVAAPRNAAQAAAISPVLAQWWLQPNLVGSPFVSRPETLALVASWFRTQRAELKQTFAPNSDGTLPSDCWQNTSARVCAS
jgi:excinuclease ABC subunit C